MQPTVSVVMPTRGRPKYVERAIESVVAQSFRDFEFLILDNSPEPAKTEIHDMAKSDSRITFVDRGEIGLTEARKLGASLSRGKLLSLLDSDDYWDTEKLERHVEIWRNNQIGLSWDRWAEVSETGQREFPQPFHEGVIPAPRAAVKLYRWNFIHASAGMVLAEFGRTLGFPIPRISSSDWFLFMRAAEYYQSYFIGETLSYKEVGSPERVTNVETAEFFQKETRTIRRWALSHRPRIYCKQYLKTRVSELLRRYPCRIC